VTAAGLAALRDDAVARGLALRGAFHPLPEDAVPALAGTVTRFAIAFVSGS